MNNIASVVVSNTARGFDREYHYTIPDVLMEKIKPGVRVLVPFGRSDRVREAYVLDVLEETGKTGLKEIKSVIDEEAVLSPHMIKLAAWMKERYICTYSDVIKTMLPPGIGVKSQRTVGLLKYEDGLNAGAKKILDVLAEHGNELDYRELGDIVNIKDYEKQIETLDKIGAVRVYEEFTARVRKKTVRVAYLALPEEEIIHEMETNRIKKIQQVRILEMLLENEFVSVADIARFSGVSPSVLNTLKKHGYIDFKNVEISRDPLKNKPIVQTQPLLPTPQQAYALDKIKGCLDSGKFAEILLHGVTGSGKTEVYLQLIQHCFDQGKHAIVLVPEISLTPQMIERFKGRFGDSVAVLHSRLSMGERYDQWRLIRDGKIKVAVGARSAVFAPFEKLGMIIIDEEHEGTYKAEITPKYHARDVACQRCKNENAVLILGSATPSVETYYRAETGEIGFVEMTKRANHMVMPKIEIVDMKKELEEGNRSVFSRKLTAEINENIRLGQQTILFLNRRGYASFVLCRDCGYTLKCPNCSISLTYHASDERLICHYCGFTVKNPSVCPKCKSAHIRHFGTGTQKIEEEIKKSFPGSTVIRMDMDTTTYKNSHEEILRQFREEKIDIMVGTQMIAKGHDFPNVTLVGVLAADSLLNLNDYRACERTFQLITQVAGRAGRGELPGRVVIQAYNTGDFSIVSACNHDYSGFYKNEILIRKKLGYPPFNNISVVVLSGGNDRLTFRKSKEVKELLTEGFAREACPSEVLGPVRAPLSKIKNKYRWRIVIKCKSMEKIIAVLSAVSAEYYKKRSNSCVELSMDINPANML
ncbi:MAG: primosomal protein N' [Clostridiales bacterium]|jgi:primosomal protein N' (replication factor Y)|nr:primosomal protein N' [Eubacteriales bacterium]MDH7566612.1 primosomal protein N' [Clostridiales bacterium]